MKNLFDYIKFLGLKKPVNIRIITKYYKHADAEYMPVYSDKTGKLKEHKLWIYLCNNTRDFNTLLAHELIHAWQEENKIEEIHGPAFIKCARKMETEFNLKEIYIEGVDEE